MDPIQNTESTVECRITQRANKIVQHEGNRIQCLSRKKGFLAVSILVAESDGWNHGNGVVCWLCFSQNYRQLVKQYGNNILPKHHPANQVVERAGRRIFLAARYVRTCTSNQ